MTRAAGKGRPTSRYELLVKIASGGMATVFIGREVGGGTQLWAIKRAHAHLLDREEGKRFFLEEAKIACQLDHPNVARVHAVEDLGTELRLVMDYVEGGALSDLLRNDGVLDPQVGLRIAIDAAKGLYAAHHLSDENGQPLQLIHRDISPHNILVGIDGVSRIADFGIAKSKAQSFSTTTGTLKGKLGYMSPEYIAGIEPDARHDIFALGVVVWELLTGQRLFRGKNEIETLKLVADAHVPPLSDVRPGLGRDFDAAVRMALERDPEQRFQSAAAFAAALENAANATGRLATPKEVGEAVETLLKTELAERRESLRQALFPKGRAGPSGTLRLDPEEASSLPLTRPEGAAENATQTKAPPTAETVVQPLSDPGTRDSFVVTARSPGAASASDDVAATDTAPSIAVLSAPLTTPAGVPRRGSGWKWVLTVVVGTAVGAGLVAAMASGDATKDADSVGDANPANEPAANPGGPNDDRDRHGGAASAAPEQPSATSQAKPGDPASSATPNRFVPPTNPTQPSQPAVPPQPIHPTGATGPATPSASVASPPPPPSDDTVAGNPY